MDVSCTTLRAGCKINLFLHVGARLANGYHSLESLFIPLREPHDLLEVRLLPGAPEGSVTVSFHTADGFGEPLPGIDPIRNTVTRACTWHAEQTGYAPALDICVRKGIPHGAGLGGGSADAAAILFWLRARAAEAGVPLPPPDLFAQNTAAIGADVPFFILNRTALASGVGEKLTPVPNPYAGHYLLLLCPGIAVSTAWAFGALDAAREAGSFTDGPEKNPEKNATAVLTSEGSRATHSLARTPGRGNDFEPIVFAAYPELARLHGQLLSSGASEARMSGTGSSFFALYRDEKNARETAKKLAKDEYTVYIQYLSGI